MFMLCSIVQRPPIPNPILASGSLALALAVLSIDNSPAYPRVDTKRHRRIKSPSEGTSS